MDHKNETFAVYKEYSRPKLIRLDSMGTALGQACKHGTSPGQAACGTGFGGGSNCGMGTSPSTTCTEGFIGAP